MDSRLDNIKKYNELKEEELKNKFLIQKKKKYS